VPRATELIRPWRGVSPEQRVAERRGRLVEAALEVFTIRTFHGAKVRDICQEAGLTERYFYESFSGKQELLMALAEMIVEDFVTAALPSIALVTTDLDAAIEGAMAAVVHSLTDDPRRARILFVESVGVSPAAEAKRRSVIARLAAVIQGAAAPAYGDWVNESVEVELIARSLIGAASELIVAHVRNELPLDQRQLITNMTRLFMRARSIMLAVADEHAGHTRHGGHAGQAGHAGHAENETTRSRT
jgi:AcrR family transcriptional regulator